MLALLSVGSSECLGTGGILRKRHTFTYLSRMSENELKPKYCLLVNMDILHGPEHEIFVFKSRKRLEKNFL